MEEGNDKLLKGLAGGREEEGAPLFSIFRPAPVPPPPPAPIKVPVPLEKPPVRGTPDLEAGLKKPPPPPPQDREMLDYLKQKINEMEGKLRESQEKGLAFAYEVKGREEARKESRREMDEFLAEVKRQQADSEAERARGVELEKARARIEALELKIMEFSAPRPEPPPRRELPAGEIERLRSGLKEELTAEFELLGAKLAEKISKETVEPLARRLDAENSAREKDKCGPRLPGENIAGTVPSLESLFAGFSGRLEAAREAAGKGDTEFRALAVAYFERILKAVEESRSALRDVSAGIEVSRIETSGMVEGLKRALQAGGAQAADAEVRRLAEASGPYDFGFITACFDNLEKTFCAAADTLARAGADARQAAGLPGAEAALIARRQAAILDSAARDLSSALEVFRGIRQEALKPIKKVLGA